MLTTCGIFLFDEYDKFLIGHVTGHSNDIWSIPKGLKDDGEDIYDAAIRELWEETNIHFNDIQHGISATHRLKDVHYQGYYAGNPVPKQLSSFIVDTEIDFRNHDIVCESMVEYHRGQKLDNPFPEIDDFKWVTIQEAYGLLHKSQVKCFPNIVKIKNNLKL